MVDQASGVTEVPTDDKEKETMAPQSPTRPFPIHQTTAATQQGNAYEGGHSGKIGACH
jgi:hypothetical protein